MKKPLHHLVSSVTACIAKRRWQLRSAFLLLLSLWLGLAGPAAAQVGTYSFAPSPGSFTPLSGGTVLAAMAADTYLSPALPVGFTFVIDGAPYTQVKASSNGWLTFNTTGSSNHSGPLATAPAATRPMVAALLDDLDGNPTGATATGTYSTTGTAPNRVFTFEWLNWEWRWSSNSPGISFQIKLYETTNRVEFVYRPESGTTTATATLGASIGLAGVGTGAGSYLALSDATTAPTASSTTENTNIFARPAAGQTYAFTPPAAAICPQPRNLSVTALTNTTANLAWTALGSGTFSIQYGPTGFTPGSSAATTVTSSSMSVSLTGLSASTSYDFYVTQICGGTNGSSAISALGAFTTRAMGPPANDACANAVALTPAALSTACLAATSGTVEGATGTPGLATPVGTADDDVWYTFTATAAVHTVTLTGSGDYVQELLAGGCGTLTTVAFSDPNVKTYTGLTVGTTYFLRVYSYGSAYPSTTAAAFTVCVTSSVAPTNDACVGAVVLTPAAATAACTTATSGTVEAAGPTTGLATPVGTADDDVWYTFTATSTLHTVTLTGSGDYVQELLAGGCGTLTAVAFSDPNVKTYAGLTVGTAYYLRVYSYSAAPQTGTGAAFTVCVTTPVVPANDECANAVTLTPSATAACTTATSGTVEAAGPTTGLATPVGTADDDVWYTFTATSTTHVVTLTTSGDLVQQLLSGSCGTLTSVAFSDPNIRIYTGLTVGTAYYLRVYSFSATTPTVAAAAFTVCVTILPANDEPCGAVAVPMTAGCTSPIQSSNQGATTTTPSGYTNPGCGIATAPLDVWFKFTTAATGAGSTSAAVTLAGTPAGQLRVFSAAACTGPFTQVDCKASAAVGGAGLLELSGLTAGTTYYMAVAGYGSADAAGAFTICVTPPATCAAPTGLTASALTQTSATLGWMVSGGTGPFTVEYGPTGFMPGSAQGTVVSAATGTLSLTALTAGTTYQFYVTQNCGGTSGSSLRTGPVAFTTLAVPPANDECSTATSVAVQFGTSCATRVVATNVGATGATGAPTPGCSSYTGGDVWFRVVVPVTRSIVAETDSVGGSPVTDTGMAIYSGACGALTEVACNDDGGTGLFSLISLANRTPGEVLYIRVFEHGNNVFGRFKLCVRSSPVCPVPVGLNATNVATTSARLNWAVTAPVTGATFSVEYGRQGFTPGSAAGTRLTGLTGTSVDVAGLTADTEYCYYVTQNCGTTGATAGVSAAAGPVCFTTSTPVPANNEACGAVALPVSSNACTPVSGSNLGATTSPPNGYVNPGCTTSNAPKDVWFVLNTPATTAGVQIMTTGGPAGQVRIFTAAACSTAMTQVVCRPSAGNNQTVGAFDVALTPNTRYYVMVAGWGSNDATGAFTICARQTVLSTAKDLPGGEISVFPNPSTIGAVTLRIRGAEQASTAQATLLNALGQPVLAQAIAVRAGAVDVPLSVQGLATGIYTLRVKVGDYTITRKVVLE